MPGFTEIAELTSAGRGLAYPATRYAPASFVHISTRARDGLSSSALDAFFGIVERWGVRKVDARALLGGLPSGTYRAWRKQRARRLGTDVLTRLSCLVAIFAALEVLYGERLAGEWVNLTNDNPIFGGDTPLSYMVAGGIPALHTVRRLLDARQCGT